MCIYKIPYVLACTVFLVYSQLHLVSTFSTVSILNTNVLFMYIRSLTL